jgi:hypothetical protein
MKLYSVSLIDPPIHNDRDIEEAENTFLEEIINQLGSQEAVVEAHAEWWRLFDKYGEIPLPQEASQEECAAVERWQDAENAAATEAFKDFSSRDGAHFELTTDKTILRNSQYDDGGEFDLKVERSKMRDEIKLSDKKIEKHFSGYADVSVDDLVFTKDTFEDFMAGRQAFREKGEVAEHSSDRLAIKNVQVRKGQPRTDLIVVDFGEIRAVYTG